MMTLDDVTSVDRLFHVLAAAMGNARYRVGQKSKPAYFCNNFVYCQPIVIIFGICTLWKICMFVLL